MLNPAEIDPLSLPSVPLEDRLQLPAEPCVYFAIDGQGTVQYVGQSKNPRRRWCGHGQIKALSEMGGVRIAYIEAGLDLLNEIESAMVEWFSPPLNRGCTTVSRKDTTLCIQNRIKAFAGDRGVSIYQLAKDTGVSRTTCYALANDPSRFPDASTMAAICQTYGCQPGDFLEYIPD